MQVPKTNAARLLDAAGIPYTLVPYEVDEEHLEASHVAQQLGEDLDRVFKTLVLRGDRNGLFVCVIPGSLEVDLKVAARISGNKSCAMIHVKELLPLTGYLRPRRLLPHRHEKTPPHLPARERLPLGQHFHQRRHPRPANRYRPPGPERLHRGRYLSDVGFGGVCLGN